MTEQGCPNCGALQARIAQAVEVLKGALNTEWDSVDREWGVIEATAEQVLALLEGKGEMNKEGLKSARELCRELSDEAIQELEDDVWFSMSERKLEVPCDTE